MSRQNRMGNHANSEILLKQYSVCIKEIACISVHVFTIARYKWWREQREFAFWQSKLKVLISRINFLRISQPIRITEFSLVCKKNYTNTPIETCKVFSFLKYSWVVLCLFELSEAPSFLVKHRAFLRGAPCPWRLAINIICLWKLSYNWNCSINNNIPFSLFFSAGWIIVSK